VIVIVNFHKIDLKRHGKYTTTAPNLTMGHLDCSRVSTHERRTHEVGKCVVSHLSIFFQLSSSAVERCRNSEINRFSGNF